ncbi:pyrimidine utilization transport protein G [Methylobacterium nonmethylotrophicum]|uniref:Pyrimidine utilization transport protein G n=2 Tax=Methylobacterium nonmethylotrophicum TaxID=1141884 RepID=A0A4Z0NKR8_9HYPH|nr:solute carrier family 23 protein [Methylobacterium nonmethylotrophicum]TGD96101.1 pyrimidine utilization transport protein G [Methylobacterium nonmethylotrophicum]
MEERGFPRWRLATGTVVLPDERPPTGQVLVLALQHVVAMFGSTALAPLLMGFDPNLAILFSGLATLLFFVVVGGRVPSYPGSSFAFIAVVIAATGYSGNGPNPNLPVALGGIVAAGAVYALVGVAVMRAGDAWIGRLMPPAVTGAIVGAIGLNLAPIGVKGISGSGLEVGVGLFTVAAVGLAAAYLPGALRRLPLLIGALAATLLYGVLANGFGLARPLDLGRIADAAWFGWPHLTAPVFDPAAIGLIAPVALVLVAENLGHVKAIGAMTGRNLDPWLGRAFLGDGLATMLSGACGGTGVTTYAENMGVMAVTRIYSTLVFAAAGIVAILFGLSPKFGAAILVIPGPVIGGLSVVVFGLITAAAGRIFVENRVDFARTRNLLTVGTALVLGAGDFTVRLGSFTLGGIGTATAAAILIYHALRDEPA